MRVALVTSRRFPVDNWHDADSPLVAAELARLGVGSDLVPWDGDSTVDWDGYDLLVLQSPWSMWSKVPEFHRWLDGKRVLNQAPVVRLGSDKRYLTRLPGTVPTSVGDQVEHMFPPEGTPRRTMVVKPLSSGGALGAKEFTHDEAAQAAAHARALGTAIVQPYIAAIDTHRELGVLTLDGDISHAITKAAILRPGTEERAFHPDPRPYEMSRAQRATVLDTYRAFRALLPPDTPEPLSVRLDFIIDPAAPTGLLLLEIEAVAPVKFFHLFPERCTAYAAAIAAHR